MHRRRATTFGNFRSVSPHAPALQSRWPTWSRIDTCCLELDLASERGHLRDDVRPGLRIVGFKRRVTVAFSVDHDHVTILRVFYGGQDWEDAFR